MEVKNESVPASNPPANPVNPVNPVNPEDFLSELSAEQVHQNFMRCHMLGRTFPPRSPRGDDASPRGRSTGSTS